MQVCSVVRIVNAPIAEVWAVTSSFGAIKAWIGGIKKVAVRGAGVGAVRTVTLENYWAEETMTVLDPVKHETRYNVRSPALDSMVTGCSGGIALTEVGPNRTRLEWSSDADAITGDLLTVQGFLKQFFEENAANLARFLEVGFEEAS